MYQALGQRIAAAFNATYFNSATHTYSNGDMADDALALDAGLVPASQRTAVLDHLLATIAAAGGQIMAGSVSLEPMIHVLHDTGHDDVLYRWANSTAYPSYGYLLSHGATTMTETWNLSGSQDHHFLGGLDAWLTSGLAGIGQAPGTAGFADPVIKPAVFATTASVSDHYTSPYGTIVSDWSVTGPSDSPASLTMTTAIPVSSPGTVEIPQLGSSRVIREDGRVIWSHGRPVGGASASVDGDYIAVSGVTGTHAFTWGASS
jgi:alpha-L-rhamnosidase